MKLKRQIRVLIGLAVFVVLVGVAVKVVFSQTSGGSSFGYNTFYQWFQFTDNTGTWHAPVAIHNSSAAPNSITELTVNTDNQFQIQTYALGNLASLLDLDTDGSVALYGASGGGIGGDAATGDTCIPAVIAAPCGPHSMHVATSGIVSQYRGQTLAGDGISTLLYWTDTLLTGSFGPYTIFTTNPTGYASAGMYRLSGYLVETGNAPGATIQCTMQYTDETGPQTQVAGLGIPFAAAGSKVPFQFVFYSEPGKAITYTVTTPSYVTYGFHVRLEAL